MKMYERSWHGIDLLSVPGAKALDSNLPDGAFFGSFYDQLAQGRGSVSADWMQGKVAMGQSIHQEFFEPFKTANGRQPTVLAVSTGRGYAEGVWAEAGADVTFHEYADSTLDFLRSRFPMAKYIAGDVKDLRLGTTFDFVTLIGAEYCVTVPQMVNLFSRVGEWINRDGKIIMVTHCALSWRRLLGEALKRAVGTYRRKPAVFWGYWNTPKGLARAARSAGLELDAVYRFNGGTGGSMHIQKVTYRRLAMTWRDPNLVMIFRRPKIAE